VTPDVSHLSDIEQDLRRALGIISEHRSRVRAEAEHKLPEIQLVPFEARDGSGEIVAIDGSYAPIFGIPRVWIVAVRAVALTYEIGEAGGYMLKGCDVNEGARLITTDREIALRVGGFTAELQNITAGGRARSDAPGRMARYSRILHELQLAGWLARNGSGITIVLDGTLSVPPSPAIKTMMEETIEACERNNNSLVGVSKDTTTTMFGSSIGDEELLQQVKREGLLFAVPPRLPRRTELGPQGTTYFVRYHPEAPKWFRTDIISPREDPGMLFGRLAQFARSQVCLGYIYPLVDAHRAAVELRKFPKLYEQLLFKVGGEAGLDASEVVWGSTNIEGKRRDAFHAYLDLISKTGGRKR
jgi:hypothetical protein